MKTILLISIMLLIGTGLYAQDLPSFFSDNMVLQQQDTIPIWGTDNPGQQITISSGWGKVTTTEADGTGRWKAWIPTPKAGGPYDVIIKGSKKDSLNNIMVGEVWLASGQSNMHMPIKGYQNSPINGALESLARSNNSDIRFFNIRRNPTLKPDENVNGTWKVSNPENAMDFSATAYYFAKELNETLNVPIGIITTSWGGSKVQAWLGKESVEKFSELEIPEVLGTSGKDKRTTPTSLYNGMLYPLHDFAIKGVIWYQGESDRETKDYQSYFTELIYSWRTQFQDKTLPFYFVQIAPFSYEQLNPVEGGDITRVRNAQFQVYKNVPNTGMVGTTDLGECDNIHPSLKKPVGNRLAYWALSESYGFSIPHRGPEWSKAIFDPKKKEVEVFFEHATNGFKKDVIKGFSLSRNGEIFIDLPAQISDQGTVIIPVEKFIPKKIRYGVGDCVESNLKNLYGLPALPFSGEVTIKE